MEGPPPSVDAKETTTALFSLQVSVDAARYSPPPATRASVSSTECLLAFQLLQFDIVLFDDGTLSQADQQWQLMEAQGQSCLFECDPQRLAQDIRDDASAALVLLVLQWEDQKARLVAFACVPLELPHLAFSGDLKRPRVSEWVAVDATWPLVNHQNVSVGSITGSVTLSCLGRALAPHLIAQRFGHGLHVLGSTNSPRATASRRSSVDKSVTQGEDATGSDSSQAEELNVQGINASDLSELKTQSPTKTVAASSPKPKSTEQLRDAAVQCVSDDEDESFITGTRSPKPILIRGGNGDRASRSSERQRVVDELDRVEIGSHGSVRKPRRIPDRNPRSTYISYTCEMTARQRGGERDAAAVAPFTQDAELPPPLYFHKPKPQKR